jgi:lipoate-protein ligase B
MIASSHVSAQPDRRAGRAVETRTLTAQHVRGLVPYIPMWQRQQALAGARAKGDIGDQLLLLEHNHVFTNGRHGDRRHLLADERTLARIDASYYEVDRGGDITYHGPGQLVGYPIVCLEQLGVGVRTYVRGLENAIIQTAAHFGVAATSEPGYTGVWVGRDKLAAIGVRVAHGVAFHGFALNVDPDLAYFRQIVPCGLAVRGVTSLAQLLGRSITVAEVVPVCAVAFAEIFGLELSGIDMIPVAAAIEENNVR